MARVVARGQTPKGAPRPAPFARFPEAVAPIAEYLAARDRKKKAEEAAARLAAAVAAGSGSGTPTVPSSPGAAEVIPGAPPGTPGAGTGSSPPAAPPRRAAPSVGAPSATSPTSAGRTSMAPAASLFRSLGAEGFQAFLTDAMMTNPEVFTDPAKLNEFLSEPPPELLRRKVGEDIVELRRGPGGEAETTTIVKGLPKLGTREVKKGDFIITEVFDELTGESGRTLGVANRFAPGQRVESITYLFPDGSREVYRATDDKISAKMDDAARRGGIPTSQSVQATATKDLLPDKVQVRQLDTLETQTANFLDTSNQLIGLMQDRPEILGGVGVGAQAANALAATAEGLTNLLFESAPPETRDAAPYVIEEGEERKASTRSEVEDRAVEGAGGEAFFERMAQSLRRATQNEAIDAARVQSMVVSLAFSAAAAAGQTGRGVSDKDVQRFIEQIGVSADPMVFESVLRDMQVRMVRNLNNTFQTLNRRLPAGQQRVPPNFNEKLNFRPGRRQRSGPTETPAVTEDDRQRRGVPEGWDVLTVKPDGTIIARPSGGGEARAF